ncbi:MAG: heparan-alpha-glucosaminide N-acetyltransferase [Comamonadaceae bacterium]|nr:DUF1624 domain-containing protein [Burkholderiales bacterium]MEB2348777.1 heparan-alpha-glucosaminide N-acetyltransferase [Comamonadaceae bacterium]
MHDAVDAARRRFDAIDALRGVALVWMTLYHFGYDLSHFGYWAQNFRTDPLWTVQRTLILGLFLLCAGLGQAVAGARHVGWARWGRRWAQIAVCALLVTAGSAWMFPRSYIYFGVLHGIALMWIVARLTLGWGRWLWLAGLLALVSPWVAGALLTGEFASWAALFNGRALNWLGWVTRKPFTEDYVPLFPWLGVFWWGVAGGQWLLAHRGPWLARPLTGVGAALALLGRHSLPYYMLHQPLLIGVLLLAGARA